MFVIYSNIKMYAFIIISYYCRLKRYAALDEKQHKTTTAILEAAHPAAVNRTLQEQHQQHHSPQQHHHYTQHSNHNLLHTNIQQTSSSTDADDDDYHYYQHHEKRNHNDYDTTKNNKNYSKYTTIQRLEQGHERQQQQQQVSTTTTTTTLHEQQHHEISRETVDAIRRLKQERGTEGINTNINTFVVAGDKQKGNVLNGKNKYDVKNKVDDLIQSNVNTNENKQQLQQQQEPKREEKEQHHHQLWQLNKKRKKKNILNINSYEIENENEKTNHNKNNQTKIHQHHHHQHQHHGQHKQQPNDNDEVYLYDKNVNNIDTVTQNLSIVYNSENVVNDNTIYTQNILATKTFDSQSKGPISSRLQAAVVVAEEEGELVSEAENGKLREIEADNDAAAEQATVVNQFDFMLAVIQEIDEKMLVLLIVMTICVCVYSCK